MTMGLREMGTIETRLRGLRRRVSKVSSFHAVIVFVICAIAILLFSLSVVWPLYGLAANRMASHQFVLAAKLHFPLLAASATCFPIWGMFLALRLGKKRGLMNSVYPQWDDSLSIRVRRAAPCAFAICWIVSLVYYFCPLLTAVASAPWLMLFATLNALLTSAISISLLRIWPFGYRRYANLNVSCGVIFGVAAVVFLTKLVEPIHHLSFPISRIWLGILPTSWIAGSFYTLFVGGSFTGWFFLAGAAAIIVKGAIDFRFLCRQEPHDHVCDAEQMISSEQVPPAAKLAFEMAFDSAMQIAAAPLATVGYLKQLWITEVYTKMILPGWRTFHRFDDKYFTPPWYPGYLKWLEGVRAELEAQKNANALTTTEDLVLQRLENFRRQPEGWFEGLTHAMLPEKSWKSLISHKGNQDRIGGKIALRMMFVALGSLLVIFGIVLTSRWLDVRDGHIELMVQSTVMASVVLGGFMAMTTFAEVPFLSRLCPHLYPRSYFAYSKSVFLLGLRNFLLSAPFFVLGALLSIWICHRPIDTIFSFSVIMLSVGACVLPLIPFYVFQFATRGWTGQIWMLMAWALKLALFIFGLVCIDLDHQLLTEVYQVKFWRSYIPREQIQHWSSVRVPLAFVAAAMMVWLFWLVYGLHFTWARSAGSAAEKDLRILKVE